MGLFSSLSTRRGTAVPFVADNYEVAKTDEDVSYNAIYVGGDGDLVVIPPGGGSAVTHTAIAGGMWHGIAASRIVALGTTATGLLGNKYID